VTVGAAFMSHPVALPEPAKKTVKFEIWDTAGQERYASLAPLYYRGASAAAVVYDITCQESFDKAKHWVKELQKNVPSSNVGGSPIVIILVGNKVDMEEQREVSAEDAEAYADENGMAFVEASAKTAVHVNEIFEKIASEISMKLTTSSGQ